ncbi:MAG TPA: protein kinase [Vicinamibacterales bacterium]|nr:protein kinase [Vicinamibacterales bacterium]
MRAENRGLADLAASVADGTPVDWTAVEGRTGPADRRLVGHLRLVESIAALHRSIPTESAGDDEEDFASGPLGGKCPEDAAARTAASGPHWGRLSLLDRVGEGTSCEVYRAWDTSLHREVALKLLHEEGSSREARTRILDEARRLARIRHQHVVQVYGAEQHDRRVGLWMELVRGESLEQAVKKHGTLGAREAALIGLDLCSALAAVHGAGLLHRDVKAQNVMREERGRIVLMDFGTGEDLAGSNRLVGTPLYLAPEIFRGQKASVHSDIYSLGVLLFYLVTGKFPVIAGSMEQLALAHAQRQRQPLRDLRPDAPEPFVAAVERALDSDPTRRFQTAGDLEAALRESLQAPVRPIPAPQLRPVAARRFGLTFGLAAGVLAMLVAALIVWTAWPPAASAARLSTLAVLPLVDKSAAAAPDLADALTEQLIATIGQVDSIRTTSLSSTLPFKGSERPRTEIASALSVDAILEGALTVTDGSDGSSGTMRVDARLIKAGSGATLWSGSEVRRRGESAALLSSLARRLTAAVRAQVTSEEATRLKQVRRTTPAAEEAYLQGRLHLAEYGQDAAGRALKSFQRAIDVDPHYAAAHASAALAYVKLAGFGALSHNSARLDARAEIRKAFETGEDTAEAHTAEAALRFLYDWDFAGAESELQRSLDLNPSFMHARMVYAQLLAAQKRFDDMTRLSEESLRMDPQSVEALVNQGVLLYYKRDYAGAEEVSNRALAMQPGNESAILLRARVLEEQKRYQEALALANEAARLTREPSINLRAVLIRLQALNGQTREAMAATAALERAAADGTERVRPRDLAYIYIALGRKADALTQFERALDEREPSLVWLGVAPRVDPLRDDARFKAILAKIGLE